MMLLYHDDSTERNTRESPVLPALAATMNVDLVVNQDGAVWLVHDRPFAVGLIWAEYDVDSARLYLVGRDGVMVDLGIKIFPETRKFLRKARQLVTLQMKDGAIDDSYTLPLLVREIGHYSA